MDGERKGKTLIDEVNYWLNIIDKDLGTFSDPEVVRETTYSLLMQGRLDYFSIDNTGVFVYMLADDLKGGKCLVEYLFYIKKEYRGKLRLVSKYIKRAEQIASDNCCKCVKIGSNIEYKDSSFIKLLKRWGYVEDTVSKYL